MKTDPHQDVTVKIQILLSSGRTKQLCTPNPALQPWKGKHSEEMPSKLWRKITSTLWLHTMPNYPSRGKVKIKTFSNSQRLQKNLPPEYPIHRKICSLTQGCKPTKNEGWHRKQATQQRSAENPGGEKAKAARGAGAWKHTGVGQAGWKAPGKLLQKGETHGLSVLPELSKRWFQQLGWVWGWVSATTDWMCVSPKVLCWDTTPNAMV